MKNKKLNPKKLYLVNFITGILPPTNFYGLKRALYSWCGVIVEGNVRLCSSVNILGSGTLRIGENTFIGHNTNLILGGSSIDIGSNVDISSNVYIVNGTHHLGVGDEKAAGEGLSKPIVIGDKVWIGVSSTILAGTVIGDSTVVAGGSTVHGVLERKKIYASSTLRTLKNMS